METRRSVFADDIARQLRLEATARTAGLSFERSVSGRSISYEMPFDVPGQVGTKLLSVEFRPGDGPEPVLRIDGPACLRHRFNQGSLCVWWKGDIEDRKWHVADGFPELVSLVQLHAFYEAECRRGEPWLNEEAPGDHLRPHHCPTCKGRGR